MQNHIIVNKSNGEKKCTCFKRCGGCQLDMSYEAQLEWKQNKAERMLSRFCKVNKIIGMQFPYNYRNKVQTVFKYDSRKNIISGVYQSGSGKLVATGDCMLEDKHCTAVNETLRKLFHSFKIQPYDNIKHKGIIRHVLTRYSNATGQLMVCIVSSTNVFPSKNNFIKSLVSKHPEITSVVLNVCKNSMPLTLGKYNITLFGKPYIEDIICDKKFKISPESFYQVNSIQTEILYNTAIRAASLTKKDVVIDAYCGTGTIGIICADKVHSVIGAELNTFACKDAENNAKINDLKNISFVNADAGKFMQSMVNNEKTVDVVIMDPPRAGSDKRFLNSLFKLSPSRIIYISCKIETLERDLKYITQNGYEVKFIQPVDMFPHTIGIETIVLLSHKEI